MITHLHRKPVVLAKHRRIILNRTSANDTADEYLIVNLRAGVLNDTDVEMFGVIDKMIKLVKCLSCRQARRQQAFD
jgi:hypothetical protein